MITLLYTTYIKQYSSTVVEFHLKMIDIAKNVPFKNHHNLLSYAYNENHLDQIVLYNQYITVLKTNKETLKGGWILSFKRLPKPDFGLPVYLITVARLEAK